MNEFLKTFIKAAAILAGVIILFAALKFYGHTLENPDPSKMVMQYSDREGKHFYGITSGVTTSYLLPCKDGYLLIDTGYPSDYGKFAQALNQIKINLEDIKYLLLTHSHDDHCGFAAALIKNSGARVIVSKEGISNLKNGKVSVRGKTINKRIRILTSIYNFFKHRDYKFPPVSLTRNDVIINGDDLKFLESIGINGIIINTPGHTNDSISVVMEDGRVFCGDAAMNLLNYAGADYRPIFYIDLKLVFESWKKILKKRANKIFPAHGEPFDSSILENNLAKYCE
jgi:glyoxylase-like metal-dependent hydrolase (beta-lactamase superfamily II)